MTQRHAEADQLLQWQAQADEARAAALQLFSTALDQAPIGMCLVGLDGRFLRVNAALCRLLAREEADLLECDFQQLTHPQDLRVDLTLLRECIEGERTGYETPKRYLAGDGRVVHAFLSVRLVRNAAGRPQYFVSQIVDLSRMHEIESRMRVLEEREQMARDLHDHVVQQIFAVGLRLQAAAARRGDAGLADLVDPVLRDLDEVIGSIRTTIASLTSAAQEPLVSGLHDEIVRLVEGFNTILPVRPVLSLSGTRDVHVAAALADDVAAVLRESLTNVAKHARARRVWVAVSIDPGRTSLRIEVADDGVGTGVADRRSGLANLPARAELHGGSCELSSPAGLEWTGAFGTRVVWTAALRANALSAPVLRGKRTRVF